jgi:cold shock protein
VAHVGSPIQGETPNKKTRKKMAEGTIKRKTDRGFGFIETGDSKDMFFHMSNLEGVQWDDLQEGQKVSFDVGDGPKGPRAERVRPV